MSHPLFKNHGPFKFSEIINLLNINIDNSSNEKEIYDIKDLVSSNKNDLTFFSFKNIKMLQKKLKLHFV